LVTKKKPAKGEDPTPGPVTTSDIAQTAPKGPEPGAAPAAAASKADKEDRPQDFEMTPGGEAMQREEDAAVDEMNERRADYAKAEKKAGVKPTPVVPQGPSALRDWKVSANPPPEDVQRTIDNSAAKQEARKNAHR
jgi:hypothetical protein